VPHKHQTEWAAHEPESAAEWHLPGDMGHLELDRTSEANRCSTSFRKTERALQSDDSVYRAVGLIDVVERSMPQILASRVRSTGVTEPASCLMDSRVVRPECRGPDLNGPILQWSLPRRNLVAYAPADRCSYRATWDGNPNLVDSAAVGLALPRRSGVVVTEFFRHPHQISR
jgi:hypothetical protein